MAMFKDKEIMLVGLKGEPGDGLNQANKDKLEAILAGVEPVPNAKRLYTPRKIKLTGAITGEAYFDGSGDVTIVTTLTSDESMTTYSMFIGTIYCQVEAPVGLESGEELYDWLASAGYTDYESGCEVSCDGYESVVIIADTSMMALRLVATTGEEYESCLVSEVVDFHDSNQP